MHNRLAVRRRSRPRKTIFEDSDAISTELDEAFTEEQKKESTSIYRLYLREIGKEKLLTRAEERDLAVRIKKGDAHAREQMIKANLRLVVKIARDFEDLGLPLLDLISEGNIGLMKGVERFDPDKGAKFSSYGSWWIKQKMRRALSDTSRTIRLPVHLVDTLGKMQRVLLRFQEETGRNPTDEELGKEMGMTARLVAKLRAAAMQPVSLDAPGQEGDETALADIVRDEQAPTPYEQLEKKTVEKMLGSMFGALDSREAEILRYRFGLDGYPKETLEEIGARLNITRERVRQLQNIALTKLRRMIRKHEEVHDPFKQSVIPSRIVPDRSLHIPSDPHAQGLITRIKSAQTALRTLKYIDRMEFEIRLGNALLQLIGRSAAIRSFDIRRTKAKYREVKAIAIHLLLFHGVSTSTIASLTNIDPNNVTVWGDCADILMRGNQPLAESVQSIKDVTS